jgi:hypothetical protein
LAAAGMVYYNYENDLECLDPTDDSSDSLDAEGWNVLYCNEMPMPFATSEDSMFLPSSWDPEGTDFWCSDSYGIHPQFNWIF